MVDFFREKRKDVPIVHIIELHRDDLSDFGRELDGSEHVHCLEKDSYFWEPAGPAEGEYVVPKRRYSAFFATDLEHVAEAAFENMEYFQTGAVMSVEDLEA